MKPSETAAGGRLHLLVNPRSGGGAGRRLARRCADWEPLIIDPRGLDAQLAGRVRPGDTVVVAGGDGTASLVVGALFGLGLGEAVRIAVYPIGTGNDLARAAGCARAGEPRRFLAGLAAGQGEEREIAVWRFEDHCFTNYLGLGLDARIVAATEPARARTPSSVGLRKALLVAAGLRHLGYRIAGELRVETDAGSLDLEGKSGLVATNLGTIAGGTPIGERDPAAARLAVTVFESGGDFLRLMLSRFGGRRPALPFTLTRRLHIAGGPVPLEIDGEVVPFRSGAVSLAGRARFVVPRSPAASPQSLRA